MPPTISPTEASALPGILEHPAQAFAQYRKDGMETVICEEKHMGSRAILAIGRDEEEIRRKFGIASPAGGACYTRTGRRFFTDPDMEREFLTRAREGVGKSGLWDELQTGWLLLDCEIMPWSFKAGGLLKRLYAPAGAAAVNTLDTTRRLLDQGRDRGLDTGELDRSAEERLRAVLEYRQAYRQYCWNAERVDQIRTAPFHLLAAQGQNLTGKPHTWHMEMAQRLHQAAPEVFQETGYRTVQLDSSEHENEATRWWESMTAAGGEGMVVKPMEFVPRGKHGNVQPALKVRGPKYLSIIYGPEYNLPDNIDRMRRRSLGGKRSLALREFALGIEGLRRFTGDEPLHRVHECAFGVIALESEPTDPRL
jgi:protein phosphatase